MSLLTDIKEFFVVSYWRSIAYRISNAREYRTQDCKVKVFKLTQMMDKSGQDYRVAHGVYGGFPHRWICIGQKKDKIIDGSISNPNYHFYLERR